ncbi:MAG: FtsW/RodA/SpoVE family cell cycle protein [Patescibacteria group bacterium]
MITSFRRLDWVLIGMLALLAAASTVSLSSFAPELAVPQVVWFVIGFALIVAGSQLNWRWIGTQPWFRYGLYWFSVALLIATHLQGTVIRGTKSWLVLGPLQFQPAELAKLALIIVLAGFFSKRHIEASRGKNIVTSFAYLAIPFALTVAHPDLGSAAIMVVIWCGFILMSGVDKKRLLIGAVCAIAIAVVLWVSVLEGYQKNRIIGFIFSERDPLGVNYNVLQSKIAIGSAGLFGKGFRAGTQTQLHFLPEAQSDFLFAAFVEEWGLVGGFVVLLTFLVVVYRLMRIGLRARDNYSRFVVLGGGLFFLIHFFINTGSAVGLIPVAGITFPFFSYGGSNVLTSSALLSIIQHIQLESST